MVRDLWLLEIDRPENAISGTLENNLSCDKNWEKSVENQKKLSK